MLRAPEIKFLKDHNLSEINFPLNKDTLLNAEILVEDFQMSDKFLVEKILNLPIDRQEEILWHIEHKPGIDIELATNIKLNEAQFREHLDISHYNYELEYGALKDTGRYPVEKSLIINPDLSADQLYMIRQACSEKLTPQHLVDNELHLNENDNDFVYCPIWDMQDPNEIDAAVKSVIESNQFDVNQIHPLVSHTLLSYVATTCNGQTAQYLIDHGAKVNLMDAGDQSPLLRAIQANQSPEMVKILISNGANVELRSNDDGYSPIECVLGHRTPNKEIVEALIEAGAGLDCYSNIDNLSAFDIAQNNGNLELLEGCLHQLRKNEPNQITDDLNSVPVTLIELINTPIEKSIREIEVYIKANPNEVNKSEIFGMTPIMMSAYWNREDQVKLLIENGADVNAVSEKGDTALIEAARSNNTNICKLLIENGAEVNSKNLDGTSALSVAVRMGNLELSKSLIDYGATINTQDINGNTPLHYVDIEQQGLAEYLITNNADVLLQNKSGNYAEILFKPSFQEVLSQRLDAPIYLELNGISHDAHEQITESNQGLSLIQIVDLSKNALEASALNLEQANKLLAETLIFENVEMTNFKQFENDLGLEQFPVPATTIVLESESLPMDKQQDNLSEEHDGFSHS